MSELFPQLPILIQALEEIQANEIVVMDVSAQTTITDYMIVCGGRAARHVKAIADAIIVKMKSIGLSPLNHSGLENGDWALVDFGGWKVVKPERVAGSAWLIMTGTRW